MSAARGVIAYRFRDGNMVPEPAYNILAHRLFEPEGVYRLAEVLDAERSTESHNEYFALLHNAWENLPEQTALTFLNEEQFRKHALIRCGYASERILVCRTDADAERAAAFMQPFDDYAIIIPRGNVVRVLTAQSQSIKAMGKSVFQDSKEAVIRHVAGLCGVSSDELRDNVRTVT